MKKFLALVIAFLTVLSLSGCGITLVTERHIEESEIYSEKEISSAMDIAEKKFMLEFKGCILLELSYSDASAKAAEDWAKQYEADEAIVLLSSFYTYTDGDGSLQKGEIYEKWNWILVRNEGENWELKTWGYA